MKESVKDLLNKYHVCDARRISQLLPNEQVIDVTITSPPYWNLKDYEVDPQIGFGQTYEDYLDDLEKIFKDIRHVTRKRGSLWIISDTIKHKGEIKLLPFDLAQRLKDADWILQDIIIWNKDRTLPWSHQGKLRNIFEYIAFYSKERKFNYNLARVREVTGLKQWWVRYPERYSPQGKAPTRTWWIPIPRQGSWGNNWVRHFNPLPPELVERILLLATDEGDVVLDPFCGSGAVLAQASVMGRGFIGLDLNKEYKVMFEKKVLPAIRKLHVENTKQASKREKSKKAFSRLIRSLRKVKYPKELFRLYRKAYGPTELEMVMALQQSRAGSLDVIFIFPRRSQIPSDFLSRVVKLSRRPPLSKYGIAATFEAHSADDISHEWLKGKGLALKQHIYLYLRGQTYACAEKVTLEKWLQRLHKADPPTPLSQKYPVIASNIRVSVDAQSKFLTSGVTNER